MKTYEKIRAQEQEARQKEDLRMTNLKTSKKIRAQAHTARK